LKVNRRFGKTYLLHPHGRRIGRARNQKAGGKQATRKRYILLKYWLTFAGLCGINPSESLKSYTEENVCNWETERDKVTGERRKTGNNVLPNFYFSSHTILVIKKGTRWEWQKSEMHTQLQTQNETNQKICEEIIKMKVEEARVRMWTVFDWLRTEFRNWLLWARWWTFGYHRTWELLSTKRVSTYQEISYIIVLHVSGKVFCNRCRCFHLSQSSFPFLRSVSCRTERYN
jgi:hypothetical protein